MGTSIDDIGIELSGLQKEFNRIEYRINKLKGIENQYAAFIRCIERYLSLGDSDFKTDLDQEIHEDGIIFYKRLQNTLVNSAPFKKDKNGATFALKRILEMFIGQGFLIEMDREGMKATYGTAQRAFRIIT